ncbi:hypothetical protein [Streptomyces scopuliridis]|uniref:hypothetical protein n=1 Tax=Streptomyces scopuliridis TaxID=452529 RepID=UPI003412B4E6
MPTSTVTVDQLIAEYAGPIAELIGLTATDYEASAGGLANLLLAAADEVTSLDQVGDWFREAAADLTAVDRLGDSGDQRTQRLLVRVDSTLYEAKSDLELC